VTQHPRLQTLQSPPVLFGLMSLFGPTSDPDAIIVTDAPNP
jgi:hypothetical protein